MNILDWITKTDIVSIKLDSNSDTIEVKIERMNEDALIHTKEVIPFSADASPELIEAANSFMETIVRAIRERNAVGGYRKTPSAIRCGTCTGACCYTFSEVRVTSEDYDLITSQYGAAAAEGMITPYVGESYTGYFGFMKYVDLRHVKGKKGCINLTAQGCKIYENRPKVCREFSAFLCDEYEVDQAKVKLKDRGRRTLRVIQ